MMSGIRMAASIVIVMMSIVLPLCCVVLCQLIALACEAFVNDCNQGDDEESIHVLFPLVLLLFVCSHYIYIIVNCQSLE